MVTAGTAKIRSAQYEAILKKGESAFIPANDSGFTFSGDYAFYAAGIGSGPALNGGKTS
jgi:mannose-6-phosphate isomerase class I